MLMGLLRRLRKKLRRTLARPDHDGEVYALAAASRRVRARRAVVVLVATPDSDVDRWLTRFAKQKVHVAWFRSAPAGRAARVSETTFDDFAGLREFLRRLPAVDCFIDVRVTRRRSQVQLWKKAFYFVRSGGLYVISTASAGRAKTMSSESGELSAWADAAEAGLSEKESAELSRSIGAWTARSDLAWFRPRRIHWVTATERDASEILPARFEKTTHDVLLTLPGEAFASPTVVDHHDPAHMPGRLETTLDVPPLTLRHYQGDIAFHGHMAFSAEATVLPSSFRYPWGDTPHFVLPHQPYSNDDHTIYRLRDARRAPLLPEVPYVDLTHPFHGHFGHIMAQTVARLWALEEIAARFPDAHYLLPEPTASVGRDRRPYEMLFAGGVPRDRTTWVDRPLRLQNLIVPALGLQYSPTLFVHPAVTETWAKMREALVTHDARSPGKIFVSRRYGKNKRGCRNVAEVERVFDDHGFDIVYPEEHSLEGQATLFGNARVIAGFGGSGMYNSIFADRLDAMIVLNSHSYSGRTEHLIALRKADRLDYFWNPPLPGEKADYKTPWEFDFPRNGDALRRVLSSL